MASKARKAVGVVRVSRVGDREGERFVSPVEQKERIAAVCARDGLRLVDTIEELDVSGGTPLAQRHGLRGAVEMVESGDADVVVVAYFDRLVRSLAVQAEVVERVERAGGAILAVDVGEVRADTASHWLSSTMLGAVAEYHRRQTSERTADAKRRAVERGVPPFPNVPPGYGRREGGSLEPDEFAASMREAFALRAGGATIKDVRAFLASRGIKRSYHGVQHLLGSRIYRGELRFGRLVNPAAHEAIVDEVTFRRVQRMSVARGRSPKSERLLARLGVLRCGSCGARMVVGTTRQQGNVYAFYRCPPVGDCTSRVTIGADMVEGVVLSKLDEFVHIRESVSADDRAATVRAELAAIEDRIDALVETFAGLEDVASYRAKVETLRVERDRKRAELDDMEDRARPTVTISPADVTSLGGRRQLILDLIASVHVFPGRGVGRVVVKSFAEDSFGFAS